MKALLKNLIKDHNVTSTNHTGGPFKFPKLNLGFFYSCSILPKLNLGFSTAAIEISWNFGSIFCN